MKSRSTRSVVGQLAVVALKLIGVPAALVWLFKDLLAEQAASMTVGSIGMLVAALVLTELALWVMSLRLVLLAVVFSGRLSSLQAFRINLQSLFYFLVIPTQAGMEAVRFLRLRDQMPTLSKGAIVSTLLLDRLAGAVAAALLFGVSAMVVMPRVLAGAGIGFNYAVVVTGLVALLATAFLAYAFRRHRMVQSIRLLMRTVLSAWRRLLVIMVLAVAAQMFVVASVYCAARAIDLPVGIAEMTWGLMGGNLLMLIPITFAGLGPAEVGAAGLLIGAGVGQAAAVIVVFLAFLARVLGGLQGAAIEFYEGGATLFELIAQRRRQGTPGEGTVGGAQ